jgi:hypothetical protein
VCNPIAGGRIGESSSKISARVKMTTLRHYNSC